MTSNKIYLFQCPKCGMYEVTPNSFQTFCPDNEWQKINNDAKAVGGLIEFADSCPKCNLAGTSSTKIVLLRSKRKLLS